MNAPLFRQEAIESSRQRLTGSVVAAVPPSARLYTIIVFCIVFALVLFLAFGSYAKRAQVRGQITYSEGVAKIVPQADAKIDAVHVQEGQRVAQGTPLVTISMTQGQDEGGEGIASQLTQLDKQFQEISEQKALASELSQSEIEALIAKRTSVADQLESLQRQQILMASQISISEEQQSRAVRLMKQGASTKQEVEEKQASTLARKLEREVLAERIITQRELLKTLESEIASRKIAAQQSSSQLSERMANIAEQRASLKRMDKLVMTAPVEGIVGDVTVRAGQRASANAAIVSVVPQNSKLEVQLFAPSSAVGFVRPGQQVRLMFDAFPYQKYGTGIGTVTWVSSVPTEFTGMAQNAANAEPVFRIRVSIDREQFERQELQTRLRSGMTLSANLILANRSLWEVFFDPILRVLRS